MVDATWLGVPPSILAAAVADPHNWRRWWPELTLVVDQLRGPKGVRWFVRSGRDGTVTGSMEIWLQAVLEGTVAHFFLRLDGAAQPLPRRAWLALEHEYRTRVKSAFWSLSDRLDPGRLARLAAALPPSRSTV